MAADRAGKRGWLNSTALGIGLASLFSDWSHEIATTATISNMRSIFRNEIDKMATKKKRSAPDFYNGYFVARTIVNRTATHKPQPEAPVLQPV